MTDKEQLELAATAAGIEIEWTTPYVSLGDFVQVPNWNPLTDDGDALRLAVKLGLQVSERVAEVWRDGKQTDYIFEFDDDDVYAATRRAIVRAAAEIGKTL